MTTIQIEENRQRFREKQRERLKEGWQTKVMHGQHVRQTKDFTAQNSWQWLRRESRKRQTESLIIAAQDEALGNDCRKAKIKPSRESATCRMCKTRDETVTHMVSECSKLAQTDYKAQHNTVTSAVHWSIMKANGLPHMKSWYAHTQSR